MGQNLPFVAEPAAQVKRGQRREAPKRPSLGSGQLSSFEGLGRNSHDSPFRARSPLRALRSALDLAGKWVGALDLTSITVSAVTGHMQN